MFQFSWAARSKNKAGERGGTQEVSGYRRRKQVILPKVKGACRRTFGIFLLCSYYAAGSHIPQGVFPFTERKLLK